MKKILSTSLVLAVVQTALTGCNSNGNVPNNLTAGSSDNSTITVGSASLVASKSAASLPPETASATTSAQASSAIGRTSVASGVPSPTPSSASTLPNDIYFSKQWALHNDGGQQVIVDVDDMHTVLQAGVAGADIGWLDAQSEVSSKATHPVIVAVIDSGMDASHPDLVGRTAPGAYDFLTNFPIVSDVLGHGTHVSGIIAANTNNATGVSGITPSSVKILPLRQMWDTNDPASNGPFFYLSPNPADNGNYKYISAYAADAVTYAAAHGASVINISSGWPKLADTAAARQAFQAAAKAGVLIIAAAGNDKKDQPVFPCAYEGVLCVGAVSNNGAESFYSNSGGMVDILAPGDGIWSTYPQKMQSATLRIQGYEMLTGTSSAAPMVSGVAGTLKSIYPNISLNELEARLLLSAGTLPSQDAALYGVVNLKRAIDAQPQPVYIPDFKEMDELTVDEDTLKVQGQISIKNLWQDGNGVQAQVLVNGKSSGSANADQLAEGATLVVPWSYQFTSLDDSSDLTISVQVTDSSGLAKDFALHATAVRDMQKIKSSQTFAVPGVQTSDWIQAAGNGMLFSRIGSVDSYPKENGMPRYFQQFRTLNNGSLLDIYDPSTQALMTQVQIPGIQTIKQVIRIDLTGSGKRDWVVMGYDTNPQSKTPPTYWQFYFLDPNFQPLYGSVAASSWQVFHPGDQNVARNYAVPGSWIQSGGKLLPSFLSLGALPPKDNFGEQDLRHYGSATHLYIWSPLPAVAGSTDAPIQLELRALDNSTYRTKYPNANFLSIVPGSADDMTTGHVRVMLDMGKDLDSPVMVWDLKSTTATNMVSLTGWDQILSTGNVYPTLGTSGTNGFFTFLDDQIRGTVAWSDPSGNYVDKTEFSFASSTPEDQIAGLIGSYDLPNLGRFWFLQSQFELVGYHQTSTGNSPIQMQTLSLQRESSLGSAFSQMLSPVVVGSSAAPLPGVFKDTSLVRGSHVSIAVWDNSSGKVLQPLRYSMEIPQNCLDMSPVQLTADYASFAVPLICEQTTANTVQVQIVQPSAAK